MRADFFDKLGMGNGPTYTGIDTPRLCGESTARAS